MKKIPLFIILIGFSLSAIAQESLITQINNVRPALVKITAKRALKNPTTDTLGLSFQKGAGAIIDPSGIIVTNLHILAGAQLFDVELDDGSIHRAKFLNTLPGMDIALIKITLDRELPAIPWGDSNNVKKREEVISVGNAYLNDGTLSAGRVAGLAIKRSDEDHHPDVFLVSIPIFKGDSGGPLFNRNGEVIGMVSAKHNRIYRSAIAIASNKIRKHYLEYLQQSQ